MAKSEGVRLKCLICGGEIDKEKHVTQETLSKLGYFHLDRHLRCPRCGWTPVFGIELEDTHPPYFYPPDFKRKKLYLEAIGRERPAEWENCPVCGAGWETHKVFVTYRHMKRRYDDEEETNVRRKVTVYDEGEPMTWVVWMAGHVLVQLKCSNPHCKYVRYFTI